MEVDRDTQVRQLAEDIKARADASKAKMKRRRKAVSVKIDYLPLIEPEEPEPGVRTKGSLTANTLRSKAGVRTIINPHHEGPIDNRPTEMKALDSYEGKK